MLALLCACGGDGGGGSGDDGMEAECMEGGPFGNVCDRPVDFTMTDEPEPDDTPGVPGGEPTAGTDTPGEPTPGTDPSPSEPALEPLPLPDPPVCTAPGPEACPANVFEGDARLTLQTEVDALDGVTEIDGDLDIGGRDITSIDALRCLSTIRGDLTIDRADALTSLDPLTNLVTIAHGMEVIDNELAEIGCAFQNLEVVGTNSLTPAIDFERNAAVTGLRLPKLTSSGHLRIENNDELLVIEGPNGMESVGQFFITGHAKLSSLQGFEGLTSVGDIRISDNPHLSQCEALRILDRLVKAGYQSLADIGGNLEPCP